MQAVDHGFVTLYTNDRGAAWLNHFEPEQQNVVTRAATVEAVWRDWRDGLVSTETARDAYGVVFYGDPDDPASGPDAVDPPGCAVQTTKNGAPCPYCRAAYFPLSGPGKSRAEVLCPY